METTTKNEFTPYEYHKQVMKLYYYKRLMKIGGLNKRQQEKYEQIRERVNEMRPNKPEFKSTFKEEETEIEHIRESMERNKQRARDRAKRMKETKEQHV